MANDWHFICPDDTIRNQLLSQLFINTKKKQVLGQILLEEENTVQIFENYIKGEMEK